MSVKIQDERFAMSGRTQASLGWRGEDPHCRWLDGVVRTPHGVVEAMTSPSDRYSRVDFVYRGHHYIRTWRGIAFSELGLARKAREFADAVSGKH